MSYEHIDLHGTRILLVDDQPANLDVLCELLESAGYLISMAPNGQVALRIAAQALPDLILLDVMMPGMDGFEACRHLKQDSATRHIPVIFITGRDLQQDIVTGFQMGGVDYITKPFRDEEVLVRVETHLRINKLSRELGAKNEELVQKNGELEEEIARRKTLKGQVSMLSEREAERWGLEGFVGHSPTIQRIFKDIHLMQENVTASVLITGESGTGKELIARAIHFGSARKDGPFVPVNCAALPGALAESLLFGHVKGAFTGADEDRAGYFEMAHEGTLFLDEMGEMPLDLQAKLLRVLEDGEVWRVGARETRKVDVRALAATNLDLQQQIRDNAFRQDLYFRLAHFTVVSPPLRQRREDIGLLAQHFLQLYARDMGREAPELDPEVVQCLEAYDFPGNVRELKNIVMRALIESDGGEIKPYHLHFLPGEETETPAANGSTPSVADIPMNLEAAERWLIKRALARTKGNISEAARMLGSNRNKIYRILALEEHSTQ